MLRIEKNKGKHRVSFRQNKDEHRRFMARGKRHLTFGVVKYDIAIPK